MGVLLTSLEQILTMLSDVVAPTTLPSWSEMGALIERRLSDLSEAQQYIDLQTLIALMRGRLRQHMIVCSKL